MEKLNLEALCKQVNDVAIKAGNAIMEIYETGDFSITSKDDDSPLTLADKRSNAIICDGLKQISPEIPIISEENKEIPYDERKEYQICWLVDPLDGTKEFIKKNGEFTVNIALIKEGNPVMGVVYAPALRQLFHAVKSGGAWKETGEIRSRLKVSAFTMQDPGLRVVCSRSHLNPETEAYINDLLFPEMVSKGSSLKFLIIASGGADLYPRLAPTMEWDTAAAQIILEEAGGKVIDAKTGKPLTYNKENLLNPHFHATGKI